jgi:hypothetical protein
VIATEALVIAFSLGGDVAVLTLVGALVIPIELIILAGELGRRTAEPEPPPDSGRAMAGSPVPAHDDDMAQSTEWKPGPPPAPSTHDGALVRSTPAAGPPVCCDPGHVRAVETTSIAQRTADPLSPRARRRLVRRRA